MKMYVRTPRMSDTDQVQGVTPQETTDLNSIRTVFRKYPKVEFITLHCDNGVRITYSREGE